MAKAKEKEKRYRCFYVKKKDGKLCKKRKPYRGLCPIHQKKYYSELRNINPDMGNICVIMKID